MQSDDTMKKKQPNRKTLRFRQWSRKAYAAFASIGRCVTIGCLPKDVADCSLSKQKAGTATGCKSQGKCMDDTNGEKGVKGVISSQASLGDNANTLSLYRVETYCGILALALITSERSSDSFESCKKQLLIKVEREWRGLCKPEKQGLHGSCHSRFDILI